MRTEPHLGETVVMRDEYDLIVIGAGPAGENVADRAVQGGLTAVIVESELVGGECSYWACMPSKALLRPVQALRAAQRVRGVVGGDVDPAGVFARRDGFVSHWSDDAQVAWLRSAGVDLVRGHGRITAEREVTVVTEHGDRVLRARHAVAIATGSDAVIPDISGLVRAHPWSSREAAGAEQVPESLVVIGGGVVGVEMATAFAGLGSAVTLVARRGLLERMEPFAGELVAEGLKGIGVDVRVHAQTRAVSRDDGVVTVTFDGGDEVSAAEVLVATGRAPRSGDIGLEVVGVRPGSPIEVDDTMRVSGVDWLYAVGDVTGRAPLTHQGKYQARAAGDVIVARARGEAVADDAWGRHAATADHAAVTQVVFSEPEVASVGLTAQAARDAGREVAVIDEEFGAVAGAALHADGYRGQARMVVDVERQGVLGATFVGPDVAEMLHAATVAVVGEVPVHRLWHAVPAYPTMSEIWLRLLEKHGRNSA